jgi:hypothetical protein
MTLDLLLHTPSIPDATKLEIAGQLWPGFSNSLQSSTLDLDAYFSYYGQACVEALHDRGRYVSLRTHKKLVEAARRICSNETKKQIQEYLGQDLMQSRSEKEKQEMLEGSINLVARIVSMMEFGALRLGFSGRQQIEWSQGSMQECIGSYFSPHPKRTHESVKLESFFTARNLGRIAGIEVRWTDNLADHLRLVDDDKGVRVFHHVSFLKIQTWLVHCISDGGNASDLSSASNIFPPGLIEETINTLALLFPQNDSDTRKWLRDQLKPGRISTQLDRGLLRCGQIRAEGRQLDNFQFWHDRLIILKEEFDQSRPKTLSQWWHDRRNGVQWYTFWVAAWVLLLTVVFGAIQSIEGALQVYKAYQSSV